MQNFSPEVFYGSTHLSGVALYKQKDVTGKVTSFYCLTNTARKRGGFYFWKPYAIAAVMMAIL